MTKNLKMAAFASIDPEKGLDEIVADKEDYGRTDTIRKAFERGLRSDDQFSGEEFPLVEQAFERYASQPPSNHIGECCKEILILAD